MQQGDDMSCADFVYTPLGRNGVGVVQPQSGLDYPLVAPSEDIRYLLADFYLSYDDKGEYSATVLPTQFPLRIKYLLNVGCEPNDLPAGAPVPANDADIVVVDARNTEILNTATASAVTFSKRDWGADYCIYEWITPDATCRLIAHTTWKTGEPSAQNYLQHLMPAAAVLDARVIHKLPKRLRSISVRQLNGALKTGPYTKNIVLKNGYNTTLEAAERVVTNFVTNTRVTLDATAGSGLGAYSECGADEETGNSTPQPIRSINGVAPRAAGDLLLAAADCLYVRRPTTVSGNVLRPSTTAQQQIGADCTPCCACNDYVDTARYMNELRDRYSLIGQRASVVNALHAENIQRWVELRACTLNPLKLILTPQCCPALDVVAMICNPGPDCYPASTLTIDFSRALELVCGHTTLFKPDGTTTAVALRSGPSAFSVDMPPVQPGGSTYVKFRVKATSDKLSTIQATLTGTFSPASATSSIKLNCGADDEDTRPCVIS